MVKNPFGKIFCWPESMQHFQAVRCVCVCDCVRVFVLVENAFKINKNPQRAAKWKAVKQTGPRGTVSERGVWEGKGKGEGVQWMRSLSRRFGIVFYAICIFSSLFFFWQGTWKRSWEGPQTHTHTRSWCKNWACLAQRNTSFEQSAKKCILYADSGRKLQLRTK